MRNERLPASYWVATVALLLALAAMGIRAALLWKDDEAKKLRIELSAAKSQLSALSGNTGLPIYPGGTIPGSETGGIFATFYEGTNFDRPARVEVLRMPFTFRSEFEWARFPTLDASARLTGFLSVPQDGFYDFQVDANDGARIWINGKPVFDGTNAIRVPAGKHWLPKGFVPLYAEWYNAEGNGWFGLIWSGPGVPGGFVQANAMKPDPGVRKP